MTTEKYRIIILEFQFSQSLGSLEAMHSLGAHFIFLQPYCFTLSKGSSRQLYKLYLLDFFFLSTMFGEKGGT